MFEISKLNEDKSVYWKTIKLPTLYPNKNQIEDWIGKHEKELVGSNSKFLCFVYDEKDHFINAIEKRGKIVDVYQNGGYLCIVINDKPYVVYNNVQIEKEGERKISEQDPYGEEEWEEELNEARIWQLSRDKWVRCDGNFRGVVGAKDKYAKITNTRHEWKNNRSIEYFRLEFEVPLIDRRTGEDVRTNIIEINSNQVKNLTVIRDYERIKAGHTLTFKSSNQFRDILGNIRFQLPYQLYDVTYFDCGKDMISYVPANRIEAVEKSGEDPYKSKLRQETKINRVLRKLNDKYSEQEIDKLGNDFKAIWTMLNEAPKDNLTVVTGNLIPYWYNCDRYMSGGGTLNSSCMRGSGAQYRVEFYGRHPEKIALCILLDDSKTKLLARALVWKLDEPKDVIFMDRIYYVLPVHDILMKKYAESQGWKTKASGYNSNKLVVKIQIDETEYKTLNLPYLDTMGYRGRTASTGIAYFSNYSFYVPS